MLILPPRILCVILFTGVSLHAQQAPVSVAVHDFAPKGVTPADAEILSERVRAELVNTGQFRVMERGQMDAILKEQGFQQSGACDEKSCILEIGQMLGVERIISGTVGKIGATYTITARMIDVVSGQILYAITTDCKCAIDDVLRKSTKSIVEQFVAKSTPRDSLGTPLPRAALRIKGSPAGAAISLDGRQVGRIPLSMDSVPAGQVRMRLSAEGFAPMERTLRLKPGIANEFTFHLNKEAGRVRHLQWKIVSGSLTIAGLVAGVLLDAKVREKMDANAHLSAEYEADPTEARYEDYAPQYKENWEDAQLYGYARDLGYAVGGLSGVGLVLTFVF